MLRNVRLIIKTFNKLAVAAAIVWWVLLQAVSGQRPILGFRYTYLQVGICRGDNYLVKAQYDLGTSSKAETRGALATYLRTEARALSRDNEFYTNSRPEVQIIAVKQTCASRYAYVRGGNQTFAALIKYTCRGVACRQRANETRTLTYQHLFSFVCLRYTSKPGLITQLPRLSRHKIYVDRRPQNSIVLFSCLFLSVPGKMKAS